MIKKEWIILFTVFFLFNLLLPLYQNGLWIQIISSKLGIILAQPQINTFNLYNMLSNKSLAFDGNYKLLNKVVKEDYDFISHNNKYYCIVDPFFMFYLLPIASIFLIKEFTVYTLHQGLIIGNIFFASVTLIIFYETQILLGLKKKYAMISSLAIGLGTGWIIYSRFLSSHIVDGFLFIFMTYFFLKFLKTKKELFFYLSMIFSSLIVLNRLPHILFILPFLYVMYRENLLSKKRIIIFIIFLLVLNIPRMVWNYEITGNPLLDPKMAMWDNRTPQYIFDVYPKWVDAYTYETYKYSETPLERRYAVLAYSFNDTDKNGLFLNYNGIFKSFFSEKGIIFNSPFLIFSLFGAIAFKKEDKDIFWLTCLLLIVNIFLYSWYPESWRGGASFRYVRYYFFTIFFLCFLSFFYAQNLKNKKVKIFFIILLSLSVLNCTSLAVRSDWVYEDPWSTVSSDLVIWPVYPVTKPPGTFSLVFHQRYEWKNTKNDCLPYYPADHIVTDFCNCKTSGQISKQDYIRKNISTMEVSLCTDYAGGDGLYALIYVDSNRIKREFVSNNTCVTLSMDISKYSDSNLHEITLGVEKHGICDSEWIRWKNIKFV